MRYNRASGLDERYGWVMVAVGAMFLGAGNGSLVTISVFLAPLTTEFGWLRGETAFAYTAGAISVGFGGMVMGYLADRFSTRAVVLVGAIGLGLSYLLLARQTSLWQFYLFYCLLGGLGTAAFFAPLLANVGSWFEQHKGLAIGIITAGQALGQGIDAKSATSVLSLIYAAGVIGRIAFGKVADHLGGIRAYLLASASQTVLVFWFTQMPSLVGFYVLAVLFGLANSGVMTCLMVCVREGIPVHRRGVAVGMVTLFAWIGMGLGGFQGGFFFDLSGDYTVSYANAALSGVVNLMIFGSFAYYRHRQQKAPATLKTA